MEASERVTWENCPSCQRPAAVGWMEGRAVEFDCPGGCSPSPAQVRAIAARHRSFPAERVWNL
jgi:hypothetical protein